MSTTTSSNVRLKFFEFLFRRANGYICIATKGPAKADPFKHTFFEWPKQRAEMIEFVEAAQSTKNVWFGVSLTDIPKFQKDNCLPGALVWADVDTADISNFSPEPSCVVNSSEGRKQAFWRLNTSVPPTTAERYSRAIAYKMGADKSGWDMVQLLRVPLTYNHKYNPPQLVEIDNVVDDLLETSVFEEIHLDDVEYVEQHATELPDALEIPDVNETIFKHLHQLSSTSFLDLFNNAPSEGEDWSKRLWRMINICFEVGMSAKEAFAIALASKCNKYTRDGRPAIDLWKEVVKVEARQKEFNVQIAHVAPLSMPTLVNEDQVELLGFIKEYREWATNATDAIPVFHDLSCFILLSALTSHSLKLEMSSGTLHMNLWGLILGDSTLARKTTAMQMATNMIFEIDESLILAGDGSVEGLLTGLSNRPGRVSIFYKDEVTGFFDSINRKDYLAGMPETLTQLYDVPRILPRLLRRETITVHSPYFIFFGGGIRDRVYSLLNDEFVLSGFLPRFLVVSGDADVAKLRRAGPADPDGFNGRANILYKAMEIYQAFTKEVEVKIGSQTTMMPVTFEVKLTQKAWDRFGDIEDQLIQSANESHHRQLALPTFTRLAFSGLKMAVLLAASAQGPDDANRVIVDVNNINNAFWFIQHWGNYSIDMFTNAGQTNVERMMNKVLWAIQRTPGVTRSEVMRNHRFTSREMKDVTQTLYDRGLITIKEVGRGARLYPTDQRGQ